MSGPERGDDELIGAVLRAAGPRPAPSDEQSMRWQRDFAAALAAARRRRRWVATGAVGAAAAAVAVMVVLARGLLLDAAPAVLPEARVVSAFGGNLLRRGDTTVGPLAGGDRLVDGDEVQCGEASGLGLRYRDADVRLDAHTRLRLAGGRLELLDGRVYVDTASLVGQTPLSVVTARGVFSHLGTQFVVRMEDGTVSAMVREGSIVWRGAGERRLDARPGHATRLQVSAGGALRETQVAPWGDAWSWTLATSPGFVTEDQPVDDALRWVARERGLRLEYASATAQRGAEQTVLHDPRAAPLAAVEVLRFVARSAPSLHLDATVEGVLRVSLASEAQQDPH